MRCQILLVLILFFQTGVAQKRVHHNITDESNTPIPYKDVQIKVELIDLQSPGSANVYTEILYGRTSATGDVVLEVGRKDTSKFNAISRSKHIRKSYYNESLIELSATLYDTLKSEELLEILELESFKKNKVYLQISETHVTDTLRLESIDLFGLSTTRSTFERLEVINCDFSTDLYIGECTFNDLIIENSTGSFLGIYTSTFNRNFSFNVGGNGPNSEVYLNLSEFSIPADGQISLQLNDVYDSYISGNTINFLDVVPIEKVANDEVSADSMFTLHYSSRFKIELRDVEWLTLEQNKLFSSTKDLTFYRPIVFLGAADNLEFKGNELFAPIVFENFNIDKKLTAKKNLFHAGMGFKKSLLPENYLDFDWSQLRAKDKLFIFELDSVPNGGKAYFANKLQDFGNTDGFRTLIKQYANFYGHFKKDGDVISANKVYIELQEKHTEQFRYMYLLEGGLKNLFRWRLNQILKYYVAYGTDPARAMVISIYIMLLFAVFYFFFPSEWDKKGNILLFAEVRNTFDKSKKASFGKAVWLLFVNFTNAFTLSVNSFVTLGFGSIPTKGLARYVCILQGFLGWFLLGLFSVALINQVLF